MHRRSPKLLEQTRSSSEEAELVTPELVLVDPQLARGVASARRRIANPDAAAPLQVTPELVLIDPELADLTPCGPAARRLDGAADREAQRTPDGRKAPRLLKTHPILEIESGAHTRGVRPRQRRGRLVRAVGMVLALAGLFLGGAFAAGAADQLVALVTTTGEASATMTEPEPLALGSTTDPDSSASTAPDDASETTKPTATGNADGHSSASTAAATGEEASSGQPDTDTGDDDTSTAAETQTMPAEPAPTSTGKTGTTSPGEQQTPSTTAAAVPDDQPPLSTTVAVPEDQPTPSTTSKGTRKAVRGPGLDPEAAQPGTAATVWLYRPSARALPAVQAVTPEFARLLTRIARRAHVDWALILGVLRAQGKDSATPTNGRGLRALARRLAALGAGKHPRSALVRLRRGERFVDDALTYAAYSHALGKRALVQGLSAAAENLAARVLRDPRISIYPGGRADIASHAIDPRILVLLRYLEVRFGSVTVSSLRSGHRMFARPGIVSAHVYGLAVDIAALGGEPIAGHQQAGSVTEQGVRDILRLPPEMQPQQVISLLNLGGASFALADHADHIHVGYSLVTDSSMGGTTATSPERPAAQEKRPKARPKTNAQSLSEPVSGSDISVSAQTFLTDADATVSSSKPDTNFGVTSTLLNVDGSPAASAEPSISRGYLRFRIDGLTEPIARAVLRFYAVSGDKQGIEVRRVNDSSWDEATITYASAPAPTASPVAGSPPFASDEWAEVDVSALVSEGGVVSLALGSTSSAPAKLASREYGSAYAPRLVIETGAPLAPPLNTSLPTISGTAQEGSALTASPGAWSGTSPITYAYQWRRCDMAGAECTSIADATGTSFTLASADVGTTVRVQVTASNEAGSATAVSAATAIVAAARTPASAPASFFAGPAGANVILPARDGALLGLWPGGPGMTRAQGWQSFLTREQDVARVLDVFGTHYAAPVGGCYYEPPFTGGYEELAWQHGTYALVSWTPSATLDQIVSGQFDTCFKEVAQRFKSFAHPVFLRTMWEFNGTWFPWSYKNDPTKFVAAWRHMVGVFRSEGVTNVSFVWAPGEGHGCLRDCYPGDAYVDWVASDGYNWNQPDAWCGALGNPHPGWCEFEEIFHDIPGDNVEQMWGPAKPFMVGETGSVEDTSTPGRKGQWFVRARDAIKARFPYLRALVYFDQDVSASEGANWRIDTSTSSRDGFRALAQDAYFRTAG
jgi:hypothetical protein